METRRDPAETKLRRDLADRPAWVRRIWATPASRVGVSLLFLAIAAAILISAFSGGRTGIIAFAAAGSLIPAFGAQLVEAIRDLARGTNTEIPVFHRLGRAADEHRVAVGLYVVAAIAVYVLLVA